MISYKVKVIFYDWINVDGKHWWSLLGQKWNRIDSRNCSKNVKLRQIVTFTGSAKDNGSSAESKSQVGSKKTHECVDSGAPTVFVCYEWPSSYVYCLKICINKAGAAQPECPSFPPKKGGAVQADSENATETNWWPEGPKRATPPPWLLQEETLLVKVDKSKCLSVDSFALFLLFSSRCHGILYFSKVSAAVRI